MATTRTFNDMLNQYLTYDLLKEELVKRDWLLSNIEKDDGWQGGSLIVPFKAAGASSVAFGSLSASNDIAEDKYVRGSVDYKEAWGSLIFNETDLMQHGKNIPEKTFLKILPDAVDAFMDRFKMVVSINMMNGPAFATLTADGDASGNITVDRPDRFDIGQKVYVDDDNSSPASGYVRTIDMNTAVVTLYDARSGGSVVNLSGYTVAQNAKCYYEGQQSNGFTSLKGSLLSATNGGDSTLYGQTKTAYPYLQAINISGASITAANILEKIFDAYTTFRERGKGNPNKVVMSYKNLGSVLKALEAGKGSFNVEPGSMKTSSYGWTEVSIGGVKGALQVIGVQEMANAEIYFLDMRAMKFHSNGFFKKRVGPNGNSFYETRATTGYQYIVDVALFGDLIVNKPSYCGAIHSISY